MSILLCSIAAISILISLGVWRRILKTKCLPYPPGPKPIPLIGNLLDMPSLYPWLSYAEMKRVHGDLVFMTIFNHQILVLNSAEVAKELLDGRSAIYSDRPRLPMLVELMDFTWSFALMRYGPSWRQNRRAFHHYFQPSMVENYQPLQTKCMRNLALHCLDDPKDFVRHIQRGASAIIVGMLFGIEFDGKSDHWYIDIAEEVMKGASETIIPGTFLVDVMPLLKHVPEWLPGAGFQRKARHYRELMPQFLQRPIQTVKDAMRGGSYAPSIVSDRILRSNDASISSIAPETYDSVTQNIAATAYSAGIDTTVATLQVFLLAMLLHPDVQKKAQVQLDEVLQSERLPDFEDIASLPYVRAIVKEVLRWQPVAPLGLPHMLTSNDEYQGYHIPQGTVVLANIWAMSRDEKIYQDASQFRPERFLDACGAGDCELNGFDTESFGFGRRICPGRHVAWNSTLIVVATILTCFDIVPSGEAELVDLRHRMESCAPLMTGEVLSFPQSLNLRLEPRSSDIRPLLLRTLGADRDEGLRKAETVDHVQ